MNLPAAPTREAVINRYEKHMTMATWAARVVGTLYAATRFLAYCNLSWATVILLNNFQQTLPQLHFWAVTCLLLLEAARLSSAAFFARLLTRGLVSLSQNPLALDHRNDKHYFRAHLLRIFSHLLQFLLICPSTAASAVFLFRYLPNPTASPHQYLLVFYILVFVSSVSSFLAMLSSAAAYNLLMHATGDDHSIIRFYDRVLKNSFGTSGIGGGGSLIDADSFHFFDFAYKELLAGDIARNVQPVPIVRHNRRLIEYLFAHRHGFDFLVNYLDAGDPFVQQAAANMVGFWMVPPAPATLELPDVNLPVFVVSKLVEKLGTGQVGWAATNSIAAVARKKPELALQVIASDGKNLVQKLAEIIDDTSNRSLVVVRALVVLFDSMLAGRDEENAAWEAAAALVGGDGSKLVGKLYRLFRNNEILNRVRAMAGYLLLIVKGPDGVRAGNVVAREDVESIDPRVGKGRNPQPNKYFYSSERTMLDVLRCHVQLPPFNWKDSSLEIRQDPPISPPSWINYDTNVASNNIINGHHY